MVFNRHKGRKWLLHVLDDGSASCHRWIKETALKKSKMALTWSARVVRRASVSLRRMNVVLRRSFVSPGRTPSAESIPLPYGSPIISPRTGMTPPRSNLMSPTKPGFQFQLGHEQERFGGTSGRPSDASPVASPTIPPPSPEPAAESSATRAKFRNLARSAVMVNRLIGLGEEAKTTVSISMADGKTPNKKPTVAAIRPRSSRVTSLVPKLQNMAPTQDIAAHTALVRHMEVSETDSGVPPIVDDVPSSHRTESSWSPQVGIVPRSSSVLGYVTLTSYDTSLTN